MFPSPSSIEHSAPSSPRTVTCEIAEKSGYCRRHLNLTFQCTALKLRPPVCKHRQSKLKSPVFLSIE